MCQRVWYQSSCGVKHRGGSLWPPSLFRADLGRNADFQITKPIDISILGLYDLHSIMMLCTSARSNCYIVSSTIVVFRSCPGLVRSSAEDRVVVQL